MNPLSAQLPEDNQALLRPEGRVLSTLESDGSRRWLFPRLAKGRFWNARRATAYVLIAIFTLLPHWLIRGKPAILLDVIHRRFTLFGFTFLPTDTFLLALFMISVLLGIFLITAIFGRVWCGWACPQTVYMEFLVRPIERLCTGRAGQGGAASARTPMALQLLRYPLYLIACLFLAHTFLAYFVGVAELRVWVTQSPFDHPLAFTVMAATTGLMLFDFCWFREQTCIIACPYGRFQSVLLDRDSLLIGYDTARGEPRGASRKSLNILPDTAPKAAGDCIDCTMCVQVCPTGIDIRDGLQIECIGCAQCIDACDSVMAKIHKPLGLIRYQSQNAMAGQKHRVVRPRVAIYLAIITGLISFLAYLIVTKSPFDMVVVRNFGRPFVYTDDGRVANEFRVKLTDRSDRAMSFQLSIAGRSDVSIRALGDDLRLQPGQMLTEPIEIDAPPGAFVMGSLAVKVCAVADDGAAIEQKCDMIGPFVSATTNPSSAGEDHETKP